MIVVLKMIGISTILLMGISMLIEVPREVESTKTTIEELKHIADDLEVYQDPKRGALLLRHKIQTLEQFIKK